MKKILIIAGFLLMNTICFAQESTIDSLNLLIKQSESDTTKVKLMLDLSTQFYGSDPNKTIAISEEAKALSESINYKSGVAYSLKNIGNGYYFLSDYVEALTYWQMAKSVFEEINDIAGIANMLSNMGAIYNDQGSHSKSLELYVQALKLAEEIKDSSRIATVMQNIGALHDDNGDKELALAAFMKALPVFESMDNYTGIGLTSYNIGSIYTEQDKNDTALTYLQKSLKYLKNSPYRPMALEGLGTNYLKKGAFEEGLKYLNLSYKEALELGNNLIISGTLNALALAHEEHGEIDLAMELYKKSISAALELSNANPELEEAYSGMMRLYFNQGNNSKGIEYQGLIQAVKDSIFNIESAKAQNALLFNYEIEKKEGEIALLEKDSEIQKAKEEKQKYVLYGTVITLVLILLLAIGAINRYRYVKKTNLLIQIERDRSDRLLLNILPAKIAEELKEKGESVAKDFEDVTVFFSDFKEFTNISESLTAQELVAEINVCFKAFDSIITSYGIEKIKTIGDSYMAAGGLHIPRTSTTTDVIMAGLEMRNFIRKRKNELEYQKKAFFEMRIGIHTGSVVAGIVGDKKFQYDIWGDTVNTASRMESNGEIDKVNISQHTYELIKDDPRFAFKKRGKIKAKGKGEVEMYFVDSNVI